MRDPEAVLIQRIRRGDTEAFAELVSAYRRPVYALVAGITGENDESDDITQACFVEAFRKLGELRDLERFGPWLYTIARNRCRDWLRQRPHHPALVGDSSKLRNAEPPGLPPNPEKQLLASLESEEVRSAVMGLPAEYRTVVTLRYVGEMSYREIAQATGANISTVGTRWHRARQMLRERLRHSVSAPGKEAAS